MILFLTRALAETLYLTTYIHDQVQSAYTGGDIAAAASAADAAPAVLVGAAVVGAQAVEASAPAPSAQVRCNSMIDNHTCLVILHTCARVCIATLRLVLGFNITMAVQTGHRKKKSLIGGGWFPLIIVFRGAKTF